MRFLPVLKRNQIPNMTLPIIEKRNITFGLSGILFAVSIAILLIFGLKPGIDFTGGSLIEVSFTGDRPELSEVRGTIESLNYGSVTVQPADEDAMLIKMGYLDEVQHREVLQALRSSFETEDNRVLEDRVDTIGPAVSSHLRQRATYAGIAVVIAIILYVAYAFRKVSEPLQSWKYGVAAIVALVHDVTITMAVFALLGEYLGVEVDIPFIVALLTILGYSVNDTIVVFDRIRENLLTDGPRRFAETVNRGVNETLVRSLNTSLTTLMVLVALFLFGGDSIKYFALALIVGIGFGTYSSIFLASPLLVAWNERKNKA